MNKYGIWSCPTGNTAPGFWLTLEGDTALALFDTQGDAQAYRDARQSVYTAGTLSVRDYNDNTKNL